MTRRLGRFEVRRELGRGAQSVVFLGFDPQLQREVAIKTLHFDHPAPGGNETLLNEARLVGKLRHPNIVPVFDAGEEGGELYLVFEYVPGETLADFLRGSGALTPVKALSLLRPILDAVAAAHAQGIIHRDLKPSNILLDENGKPRVMDFGIAQRTEGSADGGEDYFGTPAYMAPEYIERREISERTDVFAAGLLLYEMLFGRRAARGDTVFATLRRLASEEIALPSDGAAVDERLSGILLKALARDPGLRYQSAMQFAAALDAYLDPEDEGKAEGSGKQATLDFLLRRMRHRSDFPALSESVGAINRIASSETESITRLSDAILKDFALTNKLLRLVNSAYFRPAGGGSISTVSRAVVVLGFEAVRNIAITVLLFEHLQNKVNANQLKEEFLRANLAGILARDIGGAARFRDLEQTFICALFHNLGRLLSQFYFPEESEEIRRIIAQKGCAEEQAALQVLGIGFEELGMAIARQWGFPPLIVNAMRHLPAGALRKPATQEDRLHLLAGMANELCALIAASEPGGREREMRRLLARFQEAVAIDERTLEETLRRSITEMEEFASLVNFGVRQTAFGRQMLAYAGRHGAGQGEATALEGAGGAVIYGQPSAASTGSGKDAEVVLAAGIQDISNALVDGCRLNDILRIILETMYRAMGFKRVLLCVRDGRSNSMQGRFGFGPGAAELARSFRFGLDFSPDIFHAATSKGVDILISDVNDPKIAPRIPEWFRKAGGADAFVLFPLNIKSSPVALIYADKDEPGSIDIPEKELLLLRTLRNQAVLAIKQG